MHQNILPLIKHKLETHACLWHIDLYLYAYAFINEHMQYSLYKYINIYMYASMTSMIVMKYKFAHRCKSLKIS